jgi:NAD(P)H dehydrogenase (quinone)
MAKDKILVTGATGTTGKKTVEILRNHGRDVRAIVHKESEASNYLKSLGTEVFIADLLDFHSMRPAFDGIGPAYFCYPLAPPAVEAAALFAQAAVEAELSSIVNISKICARRESKSHALDRGATARSNWHPHDPLASHLFHRVVHLPDPPAAH